MPAKFSGLRVAAGDVHVFYGPCGGGFGDPLERPAAKVLDDVLDGFCTVEHARLAYGVVVDAVAETVDEAATNALRERMRGAPRPIAAAIGVAPTAAPAPAGASPMRPIVPAPTLAARLPGANERSLTEVIRRLRDAYGEGWSFEVVHHTAYADVVEVVGQLRANGATVRETAVAAAVPERSLGELLQRAASDSLCKCAETLMRDEAGVKTERPI